MSSKEAVKPARFLNDAFSLVSSYFSGEQALLNPRMVGGRSEDDVVDPEFFEFVQLRFLISLCVKLRPILEQIESQISSTTVLERSYSTGKINGIFDSNRYSRSRVSTAVWPKTYPIIKNRESYLTPENQVASKILLELERKLTYRKVPKNSAEYKELIQARRWVVNKRRSSPWCSVKASSAIHRLISEAKRRVRKRQTGNEFSYSRLLDLIEDWGLLDKDFRELKGSGEICERLLSFPTESYFDDRIYEIWCIKAISETFLDLGASLHDGPRPIHRSNNEPVFIFKVNEIFVSIYYQLRLDSVEAKWKYSHNQASFRGTPDITIVRSDGPIIIFDAKHRYVTGKTRSEETYKILGYMENFSTILSGPRNWAVLSFLSDDAFRNELESLDGRRIVLISAHTLSDTECQFKTNLGDFIAGWLAG